MDFSEITRNAFASSHLLPNGLRSKLYKAFGFHLGAGTAVASGGTFKGTQVTCGEGTFINHGVFVDRGPLTLGRNVNVGPRVTFATRNHEAGTAERRAGAHIDQPIVVGDGSWIGAAAAILGGVTIAPGCIIAAGAVVTKDTEANGVYAGIPATRIKDLN